MILFILSLFTAVSFGATPPGCDELGKMLQTYELDLQRSSIKNCTPELAGTLLSTLKTPQSAKNANYLKERVCLDLMTVESELKKLNIELAVMTGIDKLKATVNQTQKEVKDEKTKDVQSSARGFAASLNTAQSLELLLYSTTKDKKPFLQALKELHESQSLNEQNLSLRIKELCKKKSKKEADACNSTEFNPGNEAIQEIWGLITNSKPDLKQISKWQDQLKIQRKNSIVGDDGYSFIEMQRELKDTFSNIDSKTVLTKDQIKDIQKLDEFTFDRNFSFVAEISDLKDKKKNKIASDKFFLLMGDAKKRQEYEVQSKLSIAWENLKKETSPSVGNQKEKSIIDSLSDLQKSECEEAKSYYSQAVKCTENLESLAKDNFTLKDFIPRILVSQIYINSLNKNIDLCSMELKSKEELSERCYASLSGNSADVLERILQLNKVKDTIGSENERNMQFRNFALQKWTDQKCKTLQTSIDTCEAPGQPSKEALMTASDVMKISIVYNSTENEKSDAESKAKILCEDANDKTPTRIENELCKFFNDTTSDVIDSKIGDEIDESELAPINAPGDRQKEKIREAWVEGAANLFKNVLPLAYQNQFDQFPTGVNPYPYNYSPYNFSSSPQMGITDTIMFNARYYGSYGFYMPTPGYQPYTAFGANSALSAYRPMSTVTPTKYFSF